MVEGLLGTHKALRFLSQPAVVAQAFDLNTQKLQEGGSDIQGHPQQLSKFEVAWAA